MMAPRIEMSMTVTTTPASEGLSESSEVHADEQIHQSDGGATAGLEIIHAEGKE